MIFKRADVHVANCTYLKNRIVENYHLTDPALIYNFPVRFRDDLPATQSKVVKRLDDQPIRIIFVGQLAEHKGIFVLIDAFRRLAKKRGNVAIDIVGSYPGVGAAAVTNVQGPLMDLKNEFPERVSLMNFTENLADLFKRADLHVLPSIWQDPSPNVVLEAKRFGVPTVGFDVGGVAELVEHKVDGYICGEVTHQSLSSAIEWVVSDQVRLLNMKDAASLNFVSNFGYERFQEKWLHIVSKSRQNNGATTR
jgi:glycosyltransferase involved in cell wall biosynthesis